MRSLIVPVLVLALLIGAGWLAWRETAPPPAPADDGETAIPTPTRQAPSGPSVDPGTVSSAHAPSFRQRLRSFVERASELSEAERNAAADALRHDTLAREADGSLLAAESAYIQLALLRVTVADDEELRRRSQALLERYQAASERRWQAYRSRDDPLHEAYREAEADLIRRAREDGLSNDDLRERLQALREQYYE